MKLKFSLRESSQEVYEEKYIKNGRGLPWWRSG